MSDHHPRNLVSEFFGSTSSSYDFVANAATFGKDRLWKKEIIKKIPKKSKRILDLACGTGILTREIASHLPKATVVGVDITQSYLRVAQSNSKDYANISYLIQDAERLKLDDRFDCIVTSYLPKYCAAKNLSLRCKQHLDDNGIILFHDFTYPTNRTIKLLWQFYFVILQAIGYTIPQWKSVFDKLPGLVKESTWTTDYTNEFLKLGFSTELKYMTWHCSAILTCFNKV